MIPQRILLQGFLCYKHRQELHFDDSTLWMLAGLNGSGKSTVFDAVTYALFGGHRGGQQGAEQLINKESDGLVVEFDFTLGDALYRIKRTLRKGGRSTRQLLLPNGDGKWEAVENTGSARGFDEWIRDHVGLNYDTFTSSVLLMQGRADKLLNADHNERRKVLAGIVDLERYEKLHKRADELRKKHKDLAEDVQKKLSVTAEVTDEELHAAEDAITTAVQALEKARSEVERWQRLEVQSENWAELRGRLAEAARRWERAKGLLSEAETIEADWNRLRELREVLPTLQVVADQKQRLDQSQRTAAGLVEEREGLSAKLLERVSAEDQARRKRESLQQAIAQDQQREQELNVRLRELAGAVKQVELFEKQERAVAGFEAELTRFVFDPEEFQRLREECDRLAGVARVVPALARLHRRREELRQAQEQLKRSAEEGKRLVEQGKQLAAQEKDAAAALDKARTERRQAAEHAAQAKARFDDARKELAALGTVAGEKRCRHCGQELTPEHLEGEKRRREQFRANAETAHRSAEKVNKRATEVEAERETEHKNLVQRLEEARVRYGDLKSLLKAAEQAVDQAARDCGEAYDELPHPEQRRVCPEPAADWLTTTYPSAEEVESLRTQARGKEAASERLKAAEATRERWARLRADRDAAVSSLRVQQEALPEDPAGVRREHAHCQKEDADLKKALKERRTLLKDEEQSLERLSRDRESIRQQLMEREGKLQVETARQEGCRDALARALGRLPVAWRSEADTLTPTVLRRRQAERDELEKKGAEGRAKELEQARTTLEPLRQEVKNREADLELVPDEARAEPATIRQQVQAAKLEQHRREEELARARSGQQGLIDRRERRRQLHNEFLAQDQAFNRFKLLADLLGPRRLQLHLVRRAEAGIVEFANEVLDRLSAGQLYLKLRGGEGEESAEKALELEAYVRSAGDAPVAVAFLSGSQRFRVAVSLALGIGRYASRSHRPIESVIIDEGFGCLDRQGRQVMIQELTNLREQMRCILLVSHQEEFADAFANGYRFELTDGSTEVTRFQR